MSAKKRYWSTTRRQVNQLCYETSREAVAMVDAFGIPGQYLPAPIGSV